MTNILVIRHGALGDIICTMGAFKAIRQHHKNAHITILTSKPYIDICMNTGYFNDYHIDNRPPFWHIHKWISLRSWFRGQKFDRVYDLQNSRRTNLYFKLFGSDKITEWSGIAEGCSHPQTRPDRKTMHIFDRFIDQLDVAGIKNTPYPDFDWLDVDTSKFNLPEKYILLIPGCSPNAEYKRWPAAYYGQLAIQLIKMGYTTVVIGGSDDAKAIAELMNVCPDCIDLSGQTTIFDIVGIARGAAAVVGNDTGPSHIAAATLKPTLMLFSGRHYTPRIVPKFKETAYIEHNPLTELPVSQVLDKVKSMLNNAHKS